VAKDDFCNNTATLAHGSATMVRYQKKNDMARYASKNASDSCY